MQLFLLLALGIIGGSPSDDEAVVCISADTLPLCSGVLIGARTVITAGHCINPLGASVPYFVNIGADCSKPHARLRVAEMQAHPSYTGEGKPFDVGLVRLIADAGVTPMALSDVTVDASLAGRTIRHVGFGTSIETPMGGRGGRLTVSHPILRIDDDFVWSGDATANTCLGDSGGPAFLDEQVLAVVSDGPDCHSESADQRLDRARDWIDSTRAAFEPPPPEKPHTGCAAFPGGLCLLALLVFLRR
jgi:secreted trypsin-like serine protease